MKHKVLATMLSIAVFTTTIPMTDVRASELDTNLIINEMETESETNADGSDQETNTVLSETEESVEEESTTETNQETTEETEEGIETVETETVDTTELETEDTVETTTMEEADGNEEKGKTSENKIRMLVDQNKTDVDSGEEIGFYSLGGTNIVNSLAVGMDGTVHKKISYLSATQFQNMNAEAKADYIEMCNHLAELEAGGISYEDITFSVLPDQSVSYTIRFSAADALSQTTDSINFDTIAPNKDFYRNQLTSIGKYTMDQLVTNGKNLNENYTVQCGTWDTTTNMEEQILQGIAAAVLTYPNEMVTIEEQMTCNVTNTANNGKFTYSTTVNVSSHFDDKRRNLTDAKVAKVVAEADKEVGTLWGKQQAYNYVRYFDKWLSANSEISSADTSNKKSNQERMYMNSAFGPLCYKKGTTRGYALAMARLLDAVKIPNLYVIGYWHEKRIAVNYVQMPNGLWYMVCPGLNDLTADTEEHTSKQYLLRGATTDFQPLVPFLPKNQQVLKYPALSTSDYVLGTEEFVCEEIVLASGKSTRAVSEDYSLFAQKWTSENSAVASVNANGIVTGKKGGETTIRYQVGQIEKSIRVKVYEVTNLQVMKDQKEITAYENPVQDTNQISPIEFQIKTEISPSISLENFVNLNKGDLPVAIVKNADQSIGSASVAIKNGELYLSVVPKKAGKMLIDVCYAGQTSSLQVSSVQALRDDWFELQNTEAGYTGKDIKMGVNLTHAAPQGLQFKVKRMDHREIGEAKVIITPVSNKYSGSVTKTFKIVPADIKNVKISRTALSNRTVVYNGKNRKFPVTVKMNGKLLKQAADNQEEGDYEVRYYVDNYNYTYSPKEAGVYDLWIVGKGNYQGIRKFGKFTINPLKTTKLSMKCPTKVEYTGEELDPISGIYFNKLPIQMEEFEICYFDADDVSLTNPITPVEPGTYFAVAVPITENIAVTQNKKYLKRKFVVR